MQSAHRGHVLVDNLHFLSTAARARAYDHRMVNFSSNGQTGNPGLSDTSQADGSVRLSA